MTEPVFIERADGTLEVATSDHDERGVITVNEPIDLRDGDRITIVKPSVKLP